MTNCFDNWDYIQCDTVRDCYEDTSTDALKDSFFDNPFYEQVIKNFDTTTTYDVWITEGDKRDKTVGYKRMVSYPYDTVQFKIGDYIRFNYGGAEQFWLVASLDKHKIYDVNGRIWECNIELKWKDSDSNEFSYMATDKILGESGHGTAMNRSLDMIDGKMLVYVQKNDDTDTIYEGQRFIIGRNAYHVTLVEDIYFGDILTIFFEVDQVNQAEDDLDNDIADNTNADGWTF